jgi:hypothetical protein
LELPQNHVRRIFWPFSVGWTSQVVVEPGG